MGNPLNPGRWRRATRRPAAHPAASPPEWPGEPAELDLAEAARQLLGERRRRAELFGADLFADPAWEILLELFLAGEADVRVSLAHAGSAAGVPAAAARRWVDVLEERGLLRKHPDRDAPERLLVDLTPDARDRMRHYLLEMFI